MLTILAHAGVPPAPHDLWTAWNLDPLILAGLASTWALYRRGASHAAPTSGRERRLFTAGIAVVALALLTPVDTVGTALASAHMVQHLLLMLVAAPLLALGLPGETILRGLSYTVRKRIGRLRSAVGLTPARWARLANPLAVWIAYAGGLWLWHMPTLYGAALDNPLVHSLEHLTFLGTAYLFWGTIFHTLRRSRGAAVIGVFTAGVQSTLLAALLTFTRMPWYPNYEDTTAAWGLTHLADQQLAGVIMWVPGGLAYLAIGLALFASWMNVWESRPAGYPRG